MSRFCRLVDLALTPFITIEVRQHVDLKPSLPLVLAANHRSLADMWVGLAVFSRLGIFPGILFSKRMLPGPLSWFAKGAGVILVGQGGATAAGVDALKAGRSLMIMPEGQLYWNSSNPKELGEIRPGMARMARQTDRPIVPVAVDGTEVVWPKGHWPRWRPGRRRAVVVTLGEPMHVQSDDDQAESDRVMARVSEWLTA